MNRFCKAFLLLHGCLQTFSLFAQNYIPDKDFGRCGSTGYRIDWEGRPELKTTMVLPGKKILSAGNVFHDASDSLFLVMVQFLPDGTIDSAGFGTGGVLLYKQNLQSYLNHFILQPDGKIVAVGYANTTAGNENRIPAIYRFTAVGAADPAFNGSGNFSMRYDDEYYGRFQQAVVKQKMRVVK